MKYKVLTNKLTRFNIFKGSIVFQQDDGWAIIKGDECPVFTYTDLGIVIVLHPEWFEEMDDEKFSKEDMINFSWRVLSKYRNLTKEKPFFKESLYSYLDEWGNDKNKLG